MQKLKTKNKMADISLNMLIATLDIKGLSIAIKRQRLAGCTKKHNKLYVIYQKLTSNDTGKFKVKGWKKMWHANTNQRQA